MESSSITTYQTIGERDYQEDCIAVIPSFANLEHFTLCLVCDGHGGSTAAKFLIEEYPKQLARCFEQCRHGMIALKKRGAPRVQDTTSDSKNTNITPSLMRMALERCILIWDSKAFGSAAKEFESKEMVDIFNSASKRSAFFKNYDMKKLEKDGLLTGSTINCMMIDFKKRRAHVLNLGDSRSTWMIWDKQKVKDIGQTIDHTVTRVLKDTNGVECGVKEERLEGILAMSHAFGDNTQSLLGKVKRTCETRTISFGDDGFRAIVGSDGLFDHRTNHQLLYDTFEDANDVAQSVLKSIAENEEMQRQSLVDKGLMKLEASNTPITPMFADNASFIYIQIPPRDENWQEEEEQKKDISTLLTSLNVNEAPSPVKARKTSLKKKTSRKKESNDHNHPVIYFPKDSKK